VVNLQIRFDDTFTVQEETDVRSTPKATDEAPKKAGKETIRPLLLDSDREPVKIPFKRTNPLVSIANRIPIDCSVDLPSYRQAGTFRMTFAYSDLPIDPRIVFAAGVEIYMGAVDPTDFGTGMVEVKPNGARRSILQTAKDGQRREDLLLLAGIVDEWNVSHTSSGSRVSMTGRDLRGPLLDAKVDPKVFAKINLDRPIQDVVGDLLHTLPAFATCNVTAVAEDWGVSDVKQIPHPVDKDGLTRPRQQANGKGGISTPTGGATLSFWDIITKWCFLVGGIPYFVGDRIVIKHARSLYKQSAQDDDGSRREGEEGPSLESGKFASELSTPFAGGKRRTLASGKEIGVRRIVFGRDVAEYTFNRKFTGIKTPTVKVVCLDTSSKERGKGKILTALSTDEIPTGAASKSAGTGGGRSGKKPLAQSSSKKKANSHTPSGQSSEEFLVIPVEGIKDKAKLIQIAKSLYEEIARGELGGTISTRNLTSFGIDDDKDPAAPNRDPDLVRLRPGDAVEIMVDLRQQESNAPLTNSYTDSRRRDFDKEVEEVASHFGKGEDARIIARAIVAQSRGGILQLQTFFRVGNAHFNWSGQGISISFDYQNYIEARNDTEESRLPGDNTATAQVASTQKPSRL